MTQDLLQRVFSSVPVSKWDYACWPLITQGAQPWGTAAPTSSPIPKCAEALENKWLLSQLPVSFGHLQGSCLALCLAPGSPSWPRHWEQPRGCWLCHFTPLTSLPTQALLTASPHTLPKSARGKKLTQLWENSGDTTFLPNSCFPVLGLHGNLWSDGSSWDLSHADFFCFASSVSLYFAVSRVALTQEFQLFIFLLYKMSADNNPCFTAAIP